MCSITTFIVRRNLTRPAFGHDTEQPYMLRNHGWVEKVLDDRLFDTAVLSYLAAIFSDVHYL